MRGTQSLFLLISPHIIAVFSIFHLLFCMVTDSKPSNGKTLFLKLSGDIFIAHPRIIVIRFHFIVIAHGTEQV